MPYIEKDCFKCIHKGRCEGYIDRVAMNFQGCPPDKQFIPSYTKHLKTAKIKKREQLDKNL